jgi:hypothetical protein
MVVMLPTRTIDGGRWAKHSRLGQAHGFACCSKAHVGKEIGSDGGRGACTGDSWNTTLPQHLASARSSIRRVST